MKCFWDGPGRFENVACLLSIRLLAGSSMHNPNKPQQFPGRASRAAPLTNFRYLTIRVTGSTHIQTSPEYSSIPLRNGGAPKLDRLRTVGMLPRRFTPAFAQLQGGIASASSPKGRKGLKARPPHTQTTGAVLMLSRCTARKWQALRSWPSMFSNRYLKVGWQRLFTLFLPLEKRTSSSLACRRHVSHHMPNCLS